MTLLNILSFVTGWLYFFCWSFTYYPQIYLNFKTKISHGLSLDFVALTCLGATAYLFFNLLFLSSDVRSLYQNFYNLKESPVQINDILYALHTQIVCFILIYQCIIYENNNSISYFGYIFIPMGYVVMGYSTIMSVFKLMNYTWIDVLNIFGQIKLLCVALKYIPQVYLNQSRKSTSGHSTIMILFSLIGGVFSLLQIFIHSYETNSSISIWNDNSINPKIGLGLLSIIFDGIFLYQYFKFQKSNEFQVHKLNEDL